jgi:phosphate/sulfate permease
MEQLFALVFVMGMVAGVIVILMAMRQRSHLLEMQHRERMAMIERGMPPNDQPHRLHTLVRRPAAAGSGSTRSMTLGIVIVAVGLGLMSIVGIAAGTPDVGIGIGGAIMIVGTAFIINSIVSRNMAPAQPETPASPPPLPRIDRVE